MRHYEFIREYSRDKTVQNWGQKIAARVEQDRTLKSNFEDVKEPEQIAKFVADFVIAPLERADPTKNKQYVQNLIKFYIAGEQLEDLTSTAVEYLTKFHKLKAKKMIPSPRNDINRYANFGDFASVIDEYPDPEEKQDAPKGEAKEVYKDSNVRVIMPEDTEAACYYGQGTRWCTAATKGENYFDHYNQDGPMYILLPTKPHHDGEKYQIHPESQQYMDETDSEVYVKDLMYRFGQGFTDWLFKADPDLKLQIEFYPDNAQLESAWQKIAEVVQDKVFDQMFDWETNDDYYYSWLKDNDYVDDDGDIKDNAPPYDEYNEEAGNWQHRMLEVGQMRAYEIRDLATLYLDMGFESPRQVTDLDDVYDYALQDAAGSYGTGNVEQALQNIRVDYKDGQINVVRVDNKGNRVK